MSEPALAKVLFADDELVVAVKPVGVTPMRAKTRSMKTMLAERLGGEIFLIGSGTGQALSSFYPDREIGGVCLFARTEAAAGKLAELFSSGEAGFEYLAVVSGVGAHTSGELSDLVYHDIRRGKSYVVRCMSRSVRESTVRYETLGIENGSALLRIVPHSMMTHLNHFIRAQLSYHAMPVLGDKRYGGIEAPDIALCCFALTICGKRFICVPEGDVWVGFEKYIPHESREQCGAD